jgi:sulfoxide reductase heme-binding subunit YedZ
VVAPVALGLLALAMAFGLRDGYALARDVWLLRCSGWGALVALGSALSATPASRIADRVAPGRVPSAAVAAYRRMFGLTACALAALHLGIGLATYLRGASWAMLDQPFLRSGLAALVVLLALALTSFEAVNRAASIKLWKPLHRLAYVAALLALHHVLLAPFAPRLVALAFFGALFALGLARLLPRQRPRGDAKRGATELTE